MHLTSEKPYSHFKPKKRRDKKLTSLRFNTVLILLTSSEMASTNTQHKIFLYFSTLKLMVSKNCSSKMHFSPKFHNSGSTQVPVLKQRDGVPPPPLSLLPYEVAFSIIILNKQNKFDKCFFHVFLDVVYSEYI